MESRKNYTVAIEHQNNSLFTGLAFCARCGMPLRRQSCRRDGKTYYYLVCSGHLDHKSDCKFASLSYRKFESNFLGLLLNDPEVRATLLSDKPEASKVDLLQAELCSVQKQADAWLKKIEGDNKPSKRIMDVLKGLESREAELMAAIELERGRAKTATPPAQAYEQARQQISFEAYNAKLRPLLREFIEKIVVKLGQDEYAVHFKGGKAPMGVKIFASNVKP